MRSLLSSNVCPSVTFVYCIHTTEDIVKLLTRPGSTNILVFWPQASIHNSDGNAFSGGAKYTRVGAGPPEAPVVSLVGYHAEFGRCWNSQGVRMGYLRAITTKFGRTCLVRGEFLGGQRRPYRKGTGPGAPQFLGSLLFTHTPFVTELPNLTR